MKFSHPQNSHLLIAALLLASRTTSWASTRANYSPLHSNPTTPTSCVEINGKPDKIVCVCRAAQDECNDDLEFQWPHQPGQALLIQTTLGGRRFRSRPLNSTTRDGSSLWLPSKITVLLESRRQAILGWGGAFTDAAAININSLPTALANRLLASYYGPRGLEYNFGRVPIGGSDFSTRAYSYDDTPTPDLNLTHWALAPEDLKYKMPAIKRAMQLAGRELKLFASPWSPPKWMKSNNNFCRGHLIDSDENYRAYAKYLVNFFKAYREHGIEFWGATVQNEPVSSDLPIYFFNSLQMSSAEMIKFIGQHYGPALETFGFNRSNFKLIAGDDSLGFLNYHLPSVMRDKQVQRYVSAFAFHWYLSGLLVPYEALDRLLQSTRGAGLEFVMMSEACQGAFLSRLHVDLGNWARGESYASDIIEDLRRQTGAWIDWNLALDLNGGPNWAGNFVDAPIIVDAQRQLFFKQPMYYALAHFTKLIRPGSIIVDARLSGSRLSGVTFVSAHREDTRHVIVNLLNRSNSARTLSLEIKHENITRTINNIQLEPRSVSSVIIKV